MKTVNSFNIQIWVGLREEYSDVIHTIDDVRLICRGYIADVPDCITITPTEFMYVNGAEPGVVIGWINYPRFPREKDDMVDRALILARRLKSLLNQNRISITTPLFTYMLEADDDKMIDNCNGCHSLGSEYCAQSCDKK